jgi:hypothetical protein
MLMFLTYNATGMTMTGNVPENEYADYVSLNRAFTSLLFSEIPESQPFYDYESLLNGTGLQTRTRENPGFGHKLASDISFKIGISLPFSFKKVGSHLFSMPEGRYDDNPERNIRISLFKIKPSK